MSLLGNLLWLIFGGLLSGLGYIVSGLLLCLTVVGIPFGLMSMRIGVATLTPFGKEVVERPHANSPLRVVFNVIWLVFFGWGIAVAHLAAALVLFVTIIGIPFGIASWKMIPLSLFPLGRQVVPIGSVGHDPYGIPT